MHGVDYPVYGLTTVVKRMHMEIVAVSFLALTLIQVFLMALVLRAINGRFFYGLGLGIFAALWFPSLMAIAHASNPALTLIFAVTLQATIWVPGILFAFAYRKIRPKEASIRDMLHGRGFKFFRQLTSFYLVPIGFPLLGIIIAAWFLLFRRGEFLKAR